ncbi:MAG: hypothetical protein U0074_02295 [Kouleothrix sp.]
MTTTVTSGGGLYQFTNLRPGDYLIVIDQTNSLRLGMRLRIMPAAPVVVANSAPGC